ncbi:MAG: rhodanese-like domain-containing protein [Bacteroidota bacterium]
METPFENLGFVINNIRHLSPREAFECIQKGAVLVDVREEFETRYKQYDVKDTVFCPFKKMEELYTLLSKEKLLIIACSVGLSSKKTVAFLQQKGYANIANLAGGIVEWERDGLPIITNKKEELSGSCLCRLRPKNKLNKD